MTQSLEGMVDDRIGIPEDNNILEWCAEFNKMKLDRNKCKVIHLHFLKKYHKHQMNRIKLISGIFF